jgi:DNA-binding XRE family transcriptional regulator
MATAAEHYAQAERYLGAAMDYELPERDQHWYLAAAQVHATLALAPRAVAAARHGNAHGFPPCTADGSKIRQMRIDRRVTQADLARQIGYSHTTICKIETQGDYPASRELTEALAEWLGIQVEEILIEKDPAPGALAS